MYPQHRSYLLACFDLFIVVVVWWIQKWLGHGSWQTNFWSIFLVLSITSIGFLYVLDTYHLGRDRSKAKILILITIASGGFHIVLPFIFRAFDTSFSLAAITISFLISTIYLFCIRTVLSRISSYQKGNLIVIGEEKELEWTQKFYANISEFKLVGFVTIEASASTIPNYLGHVDKLSELIEQYQVDTICISYRKLLPESLSKQLLSMKLKGLTIVSFSEFCQSFGGYIPLEYINEQWFLKNFGLPHLPFLLHIKRLLDVCFGFIGLILLCPTMLVVAIINQFYNPGPLLYSQMRVGLYSKEFRLFKFRSMSVDAEKKGGAQWAQEGDDRATAWGHFMRQTHLDELPQMWNVLIGNMSLVGPRPERREIIQKIEVELPFYELRHLIKPGITGWAQMNIHYADSLLTSKRKLEYDLFYIRRLSLIFDLIIIVKTVRVILFSRGR